MAKYTRKSVGSILKSKEASRSNYLKINLQDKGKITLKHGDVLEVKSKKFKLEEIERLRAEGRIEESKLEKMQEYAEKMPDFVLAEVVLVTKEE